MAFFASIMFGQKPLKPTPLQKATVDVAKLTKKSKMDQPREKINSSGRGYIARMNVVGSAPKRVALVSFYTFDPGTTVKTGNMVKTTNVGEAQGSAYATAFYTKGIESLKSTFKTYGMEVLTPDQYLTDDTKKKYYNDFVVKNAKSNELGNKFAKWAKNAGSNGTSIVTNGPADGFRTFKIHYDLKDPFDKWNLNDCQNNEMMECMGYDLAKALDVDAVIVIYNTMTVHMKWFKDRYCLHATSMYMFGPNPTPLKEGKDDNKYYSKGIFYSGTRISFGESGILLNPKEPKKATPEMLAEIEKNRFNGYENILAGLATKMGDYIKEELAKPTN